MNRKISEHFMNRKNQSGRDCTSPDFQPKNPEKYSHGRFGGAPQVARVVNKKS
jgi:hypothetical protein